MGDFQCTACGDLLAADEVDSLLGHCGTESDANGDPVQVHCGPCEMTHDYAAARIAALEARLAAAEAAQRDAEERVRVLEGLLGETLDPIGAAIHLCGGTEGGRPYWQQYTDLSNRIGRAIAPAATDAGDAQEGRHE
jgi:hypothetical protein